MKRKLKNPYLVTGVLAFLILLVVFVGKGIFPFGKNTLIFGDMHDQITAFYYHFYDSFHGNKSLLIDFTTSGGIDFIGILAYYILSPFSFLLLLFPREDIYMAVSIVIALKILTASLTCLYSIRVLWKGKCPFLLSVILALSYAFSGYSLILYQITPWMDAMYLFPLVVVGLKRVLDLEKPYLYIGSLTLSIIFSFYVSYMSLIFIFFLSFVYLFAYKKKEDFKKSILALGLSTILAMGLAMFITLPAVKQVSESSRLGFSLITLLNSKTGPLTDKISYFLPTAFLSVALFLLLLDFKNHKKFLKWYFPCLLFLGIPYIMEPVNKVIHFFSYAFFPNRYGYIMFYFLVLGAGYYFTKEKAKKEMKNSFAIAIMITLFTSAAIFICTVMNYTEFQEGVYELTISKDKYLIFIAIFMSVIAMIGICSIIFLKRSKTIYPYILVITCVHLACNCYLYMGLSNYQEFLHGPYQIMNQIYQYHDQNDFYRLKTSASSLVTNNGMVTDFPNLDHFTSLVNGNNVHFLKQLGYNSHWTKTFSKNGTLFTDSILANQYFLTYGKPEENLYDYVTNFEDYKLFKLKNTLSYGYFTKNVKLDEDMHTFVAQNELYKAITGKEEDLFQIYDDFEASNLKIKKTENGKTHYKIQDSDGTSYLKTTVPVKEKSIVYLELFNSYKNTEDDAFYHHLKIYVNGELFKSSYPIPTNNGCLRIGTFENQDVDITIEFIYDTDFSYVEVGVLNEQTILDFMKSEKVDSTVNYEKNKIHLNVKSNEEGLFMIPVPYSTGYEVFVNDKKESVEEVYGNFLGVHLDSGENKITFVYTPPGLKSGVVISLVSLFLLILLFKMNLYKKILENKILGKVVERIYFCLYILAFFFIYFIPTICFILSYFMFLY